MEKQGIELKLPDYQFIVNPHEVPASIAPADTLLQAGEWSSWHKGLKSDHFNQAAG